MERWGRRDGSLVIDFGNSRWEVGRGGVGVGEWVGSGMDVLWERECVGGDGDGVCE